MGTVRARTTKEKDAKFLLIIEAMVRLLKNQPYNKIPISLIAKEAQIAKSTLYVYADTKEELFIRLFEHRFLSFLDRVEIQIPQMDCAEDFASKYSQFIAQDQILLTLIETLHPLMEKNVSLKTLVSMKIKIVEKLDSLNQMLAKSLNCSIEQTMALSMLAYTQTIGVYQFTNLSEELKEALQNTPANILLLDFEKTLKTAITIAAHGLGLP
jgi:AcrR family transcriptional regulator